MIRAIEMVEDSGAKYRREYLTRVALSQLPSKEWRAVDPKDVHRIQCDCHHLCGEQAVWASESVLPCSYVCAYHRAVYDANGRFWEKDRVPGPRTAAEGGAE